MGWGFQDAYACRTQQLTEVMGGKGQELTGDVCSHPAQLWVHWLLGHPMNALGLSLLHAGGYRKNNPRQLFVQVNLTKDEVL